MLKIGLTGGIGSGKSTVAKVFETMDIPVYYADDAAKRLMNTDEKLIKEIKKYFGEESYINGNLNRSFIANLVFTDKKKLEFLNSLVHPVTIADAEAWISAQTTSYVIREAALLFESGANKGLDFTIGVSAPLPLRIQRVMQRDGLTEDEVYLRISRQMDEEEKITKCDFTIINDEEQLVIPQVLELDKKFKKIIAQS
jgi:dephospho-CoA kinase